MTTSKREPAWAHNGKLTPKGQLTIVSAVMGVSDTMVNPRCIWVDEVGIEWSINRISFKYELEPHTWPTDVHGVYHIGYKPYHSEYVEKIVADSYDEAVQKLVEILKQKWHKIDTKTFSIKCITKASD